MPILGRLRSKGRRFDPDSGSTPAQPLPRLGGGQSLRKPVADAA